MAGPLLQLQIGRWGGTRRVFRLTVRQASGIDIGMEVLDLFLKVADAGIRYGQRVVRS